MSHNPQVGIVIGSKSDEDKLQKGLEILKVYGIEYEMNIISAHRTPNKAAQYAKTAKARGIKVIIAAAGLSAALPGVLAAHTTLPVIGLPIGAGPLSGKDALYSMVQMPPGIPVATVGIDNAPNAVHLAAQILALTAPKLSVEVEKFRAGFGDDK
jgi:5-(carboxyamino)imidazole ribonucleotide mutase